MAGLPANMTNDSTDREKGELATKIYIIIELGYQILELCAYVSF